MTETTEGDVQIFKPRSRCVCMNWAGFRPQVVAPKMTRWVAWLAMFFAVTQLAIASDSLNVFGYTWTVPSSADWKIENRPGFPVMFSKIVKEHGGRTTAAEIPGRHAEARGLPAKQ